MSAAPRFDAQLIARYDRQGPRYTSYPTAVQFHTHFGASDYREAALQTNRNSAAPLSLYVHVPFCASPCFYCGCNKVITRDLTKAQRYLESLQREIALQAPLFSRSRAVQQLHFGGGTPTFLSSLQLRSLMDALAANFFLISSTAREYSIEIDPRTLLPNTLADLAQLGFNRVSMGVQDFDADVQRAVNRVQSADDTLRAIATARREGFESVSIDLIYGLPRQTPASFARTLDIALDARPDRLAVYGYAHMPRMFKAQRQINEGELPNASMRIDLLRVTIEKLTGAGYTYVGMDHFALPTDELAHAQRVGRLHRNFQGYSTRPDCDLVGLGVSAIGKIGNTYAQNAKTLPAYYAAVDSNRLPIERGIELNQDDLLRREIIQQIMCQGEVDIDAVEEHFAIDFDDYFAAELTRLQLLANDALVTINDRQIEVTPQGRLLLRNIAMTFDAYLPSVTTPKFSKAI